MIEDKFFNLCVGRSLNFKIHEFSSIHNALTNNEIKKRLKIEVSRKDFNTFLKRNKKKFIIKVPDLARSFIKLQKYYPHNKFIIIKRNSKSIMASINKKKWFNKNNYESPTLYSNKNWLPPKLHKIWINSSNKNKEKIFIDNFEKDINKIKNKLIVHYESLLEKPNKVINEICAYLNLKKTHKTKQAISQVYSK